MASARDNPWGQDCSSGLPITLHILWISSASLNCEIRRCKTTMKRKDNKTDNFNYFKWNKGSPKPSTREIIKPKEAKFWNQNVQGWALQVSQPTDRQPLVGIQSLRCWQLEHSKQNEKTDLKLTSLAAYIVNHITWCQGKEDGVSTAQPLWHPWPTYLWVGKVKKCKIMSWVGSMDSLSLRKQ